MIKHIQLRTCVLFYVIFIVSFIIPIPVRSIGGVVVVPAAILDFYSEVLRDYRWLDSQEKWQLTMTFLFFLIVHLAIVTLISVFISSRFAHLMEKRYKHTSDNETPNQSIEQTA